MLDFMEASSWGVLLGTEYCVQEVVRVARFEVQRVEKSCQRERVGQPLEGWPSPERKV